MSDSRDNKTYKTVVIGSQTWMAENLNYAIYSSVCYDNKSDNCAKYGRLYNYSMAMSICPSGWHLPSEAEWDRLIAAVGGDSAGTKLKSTDGWNSDGNGTDQYEFSALPGGYSSSLGRFSNVGNSGYWWSAMKGNSANARSRNMSYDNSDVISGTGKSNLYSVRCVRD